MASYIEVNESEFKSKVLDSEVPVLVDFWAPWCGPCRAIAPHVEAMAKEFAGKATVAKVNVDHNPGIAGQYGIRGIPALLLFKGGKVVNQIAGMPPNPADRLRTLIQSAL